MVVLAAVFRIRPSGEGLARPGLVAVTSAITAQAWVVGVNMVAVEMSVGGVELRRRRGKGGGLVEEEVLTAQWCR